MRLTLNPGAVIVAAQQAVLRNANCLFRPRQQMYGCNQAHHWQMEIDAMVAEAAVAAHYNLYWCGALKYDQENDDVGGCYQVRYTPRTDGHLLMHPRDKDTRPYILVTGFATSKTGTPFLVENGLLQLDAQGWLWGYECKQRRWWREQGDRSCYWVPQDAPLHHMQQLPSFAEVLRFEKPKMVAV